MDKLNVLSFSCPNCGAPLDPNKEKCEYCETHYYMSKSSNGIAEAGYDTLKEMLDWASSKIYLGENEPIESEDGDLWVDSMNGYIKALTSTRYGF